MHSLAQCTALLLVSVLLLAPSAGAGMIELETYQFDAAAGEPQLPTQLTAAAGDYADYGYYLVQSNGPVEAAWLDDLASEGADLYGYVPEFAYLVGMDASTREAVATRADLAWIGLYHPAYKLSPQIGDGQFVSPERQDEPGYRLMVRVFRDLDGLAGQIETLGGTVLDRVDDGFSKRVLVQLPAERLGDVARLHDVWWIEEQPEFVLMNNTTRWVTQSNASGWVPLWDQGINGEGQIATIMDSGVDYNSCWFRENGGAAPGPSHRKIIDYSVAGGGVPYDGCDIGHGSHVAGTMCGDQSYINPGNTNYNGMAYKAKMTVQDIGTDDWSACNLGTVAVPSSLSSSFLASRNLGARVHQNSWGSTSNAYDGYCVDIDNMMWNNKDFLVCFAAGNSGPGGSTVGSPGTAKNCVTVGSTRQAPQQDTMAGYSSRGPSSDNRYKPTVTAPGGESPTYITSVDNHPGNPPAQTCNTVSDPFQGTSMATPAVSGMALNVRQYFTDGFYPQGATGGEDPFEPQAALVKAMLISSTDDMAAGDIPNNNEGWGRILMDNSLYFEGDTRELIANEVEPGLNTGQEYVFEFEVDSSSEPLVVTVVWTDYPGTSGTNLALINDLDLLLIAPGGTQYRGNVFSGGFSATGGSHDRRNVEECARVASPAAGTWTVRVIGYNVPQGPQPFALVVNGAFANWPPAGFSDVNGEPNAGIGKLPLRIAAYPNPMTHSTQLSYAVPSGHEGLVQVNVVDVTGRTVRHLVAKGQRTGEYFVTWDGLNDGRQPVTDGVYFARITAGGETKSARIVLQH